MRYLVTGVTGFIGSHFARYLAEHVLPHDREASIVGVTRNTNQRNFKRIELIKHLERFTLVYKDIARDDISELLDGVDFVVNFAAKTFVDHSIRDPSPFIESNIIGTFKLLEEARKSKQLEAFLQVSTDEVYGQILEGAYKEDAPLNPRNPYASTKAAADMLCLAYYNTYGTPIIITRTENNYGPFQHPQKAIPTFVREALLDKSLPVYGDGKHRRMWLHVEDHCSAILHLLQGCHSGKPYLGGIFHVAGKQELENLDLARTILELLNKPVDRIRLVPDFDIRPGHDRRYALNTDKLYSTGWRPSYTLQEGLRQTVEWYKNNPWWFT